MQGIVRDANTGKPLYPVTVVNVITQLATSTDEKGLYTIPANNGDVIAFTYIGYKTVKRTKPNSILIATQDVKLEPTEYQLKEFSFRPGHLNQYQMDSAERASIYKVAMRQHHPSPFASPVSALAEKFSKKAKQVYRFQKTFTATEREKFLDTRYNPEVVISITNLTGDSVGHFMYAYPLPYDFARTATDLELKMWIRTNYRLWLRTISQDTVANKH